MKQTNEHLQHQQHTTRWRVIETVFSGPHGGRIAWALAWMVVATIGVVFARGPLVVIGLG